MHSPLKYKALLGDALRSIAETRTVLGKVRQSQKRLHTKQSRLLAHARRSRARELQMLAAQARLAAAQADLKHEVTELRSELRQFRQEDAVALRDELALQHEIVATNTAAFGEYKDAFRGRDVVIVASGPTLAHYDPIPDAIHIGVNAVIGNDRVPHDIHFAQDFGGGGGIERVLKLYDNGRVPSECQLFLGLLALTPNGQMEASESLANRLGATRYFVNAGVTRVIHRDIRFHPLMDFYTVVFPALHFALFTNPRRIYLVGCDTSYFGHFDGSPQRETDDQIRTYLTNRLVGYRRAREFARTWYTETEIISVNPVNLTGLFTDTYSADADYRRSQHQALLVEGGYSDEAIHDFVERHLAEARSGA